MATGFRLVSAYSAVLLCHILWATPVSAQAQEERSRATLGVLAFTNAAMRDRSDWEAQRFGVAELITTLLRYHPRVTVLERQQLEPLLAEQDLGGSGRVDAETAARIGKLLGARFVLLGTISVDPRNRLRLAARAVDVETSRILDGEMVQGDANDVHVLVDSLTELLLAGLSLPALPVRRNPEPLPPSLLDSSRVAARASAPSANPDSALAANASLPALAARARAERRTAANGGSASLTASEVLGGHVSPTPPVRPTVASINAPARGERAYRAFQLMAQALVAERRGRPDVAVTEYRRALQLMPELVAARDNLARLTTR